MKRRRLACFATVARRRAGAVLAAALLLVAAFAARPARAEPPAPGGKAALKVATRVVPPFVQEDKGELTGFSVDLWRALAARMGVESELRVKATVPEALASLEDGTADVAISAISITVERDKRFDFSQPMFESGLQVLVRGKSGPATSNPIAGLVSLLFSRAMLVWLGIAVAMIVVPAHVVWLLERAHPEGIVPTRAYFPGIFHAAWWAAGTLATQADQMPKAALARVMAVFWMFTGVVFVAYFTAQVTASLTVQRLQGDIRGPDDLPGKRVATTAGSTSADYLRGRKAVLREFTKLDEAYHALLAGEVDAIVFDAPVLQNYAANEGKGGVQLIGPVFRKENYGIAVAAGSPLRRSIDIALLSLREDGTYQQVYDKWFASK